MSRYIAHKVRIDETVGDSMGDAQILDVDLRESNEEVHAREDEERNFVRAVEDLFFDLDDGEALVLHRVVI